MNLILKKNKGFKTFLKMYNIINGGYKTEEKYVNIRYSYFKSGTDHVI
jgi:hypothetical protein